MRIKVLAVAMLAVVLVGSLLAFPRVEAAPPQPYNLYGIARDASAALLPLGTRITAFIDGVDYSNGTSVYDNLGHYDMDTYGDWVTGPSQPNTPEVKEGGDVGDAMMVVAGDMTTTGSIFTTKQFWTPGDVVSQNLALASMQPSLLKIARITTIPVPAGTQYLYICNPTSNPVDPTGYYLQKDDRGPPGSFSGATHPIAGAPIPPGGLLYVDLTSWTPASSLTLTGDALKLVWTNPAGGTAFGGTDVVIDRVEYNQTGGPGTLYWEPGNTIMSDSVAPGSGQEIHRTVACGDTNNNAVDFTIGPETGRPGANNPPTVTLTAPVGGEIWTGSSSHTIRWTQADIEDTTLSVTVENSTTGPGGPWWAIYSNPVEPNGQRTHAWTVPCVDTTQAFVRVRVFDSGGLPALSQSGAFTIDCTRPTLDSTTPLNGSTGIGVGSPVILTFSEPMNRTATQGAIAFAPPVGGLGYVWSNLDKTVTISHSNFLGNTLYTVTVACTAKDVSDPGNQLAACPRVFTFRTVLTNTAPTVVLTSPVGGEVWSGGSTHAIAYTTTDPDDNPITVDTAWSDNGGPWTPIQTGVSQAPGAYNPNWLVPSVNTIHARVRVCATDSANPQVCASSPADFTIDSVWPTVVGRDPINGQNDVAFPKPVRITFSKTMARAATEGAVSILPAISGPTFAWSASVVTDDTLTVSHNNFLNCTTYTVTVSIAAKDTSNPGNTLAAADSWSFSTACAPVVTLSSPAGGEVYSGNSQHFVVFTLADNVDTLLTVWINITTDGINWSPLSAGTPRSVGARSVQVTIPNVDSLSARIRVTAQDSTGLDRPVTSPIFWIDATAPLVSNSTPAAAATGVDVSAPFTIIFSESMDRISANGSISLSPGTWTLTFTWSANSKTVTVDHTPALATDTQYLLSVGTSALDASDPGNFLGTAYQASFHTSTAAAVTANAGGPYTGHVGDTITLDGSQSTGAGLNYTWAIVRRGGGGSAFVYGQRPTYTFTAEGVYDIGLVVRDSSGNVDTDTTTATISAAQQPSDFLSQYWWVLLILIIAIVAALLFLVMGRRRKKEEAPGEQTPAAPSRPPSRPAAPPPRAAPVAGTTAQGAKPQTRECPSCGTIVDVTDTECFMCGTKL